MIRGINKYLCENAIKHACVLFIGLICALKKVDVNNEHINTLNYTKVKLL